VGDLQIEQGSGAQPTVTFYSDGVATDLDGACTVTLVKPDGTAGPASGTVSHVGATGSGTYRFTLGQQTELTYYDVSWAGTIGTVAVSVTTRVEVVGSLLYTLAALRAVKVAGGLPFVSTTEFPSQLLMDKRLEVTDDFEQRCGWSFVPRYAREVHDGDGTGTLLLDHLKCSRLLSVTVNGVAQPAGSSTLDRSGILRATSNYTASGSFPGGVGNVAVEYVHGFERPPAAISTAALARTAMLLAPSQVGATASSWTTPDGTTYTYDAAGRRLGSGTNHYGVPAIAEVLNDPAYSARGGVFA